MKPVHKMDFLTIVMDVYCGLEDVAEEINDRGANETLALIEECDRLLYELAEDFDYGPDVIDGTLTMKALLIARAHTIEAEHQMHEGNRTNVLRAIDRAMWTLGPLA